MPSRTPVRFLSLIMTLVFLPSCSPGYVFRAGWEETKILWQRRKLSSLLESPETPESLKQKFRLVLDARQFAKDLGLEPGGSYAKYADVNRDVLLWVLNASPKTSLKPFTWWFPFVGSVPYKGFFEKNDALSERNSLAAQGLDVYLRPSPAFSTLGWFDDPLLSTITRFDDEILVNTVLHELLHNTVWIKNHVTFNETLANIFGSLAAEHFFRTREGEESTLARLAQSRRQDELVLARFLEETEKELNSLYTTSDGQGKSALLAKEGILTQRENIFRRARERWPAFRTELKTANYDPLIAQLNNAVIFAQRIYLDRPWLILDFYEACGRSLPRFVQEIRQLAENSEADPFFAAAQRTELLYSLKRAEQRD